MIPNNQTPIIQSRIDCMSNERDQHMMGQLSAIEMNKLQLHTAT